LYKVAVVKGMTAKDFLQSISTRKDNAADYLDTLFEEVKETGRSREIHLINYAINRDTPWNDVFIPTLELCTNPVQPAASQSGGGQGSSSKSGGESGGEYVIQLKGFALFNGDKLSEFLEDDNALALNILNNEAKGGQVTVTGKDGRNVSLELMKCTTNIKTSYRPLSVSIDVSIDFNLAEYTGENQPMDKADMKYIEQQQDEYIRTKIEQVIQIMKQAKSDAADFGDKFYHSDPIKWQEIKSDWKDIFPQVQFNVKVDSKIISVYELEQPVS
jgi:Ger(x)C family germination protein